MKRKFLLLITSLLLIHNTSFAQDNAINIGINISDYEYVNVFKETGRINYIEPRVESGTEVHFEAKNLDENLWPTMDFWVILMDNRPVAEWINDIDDPETYRIDYSGVYWGSFNGQAELSSPWSHTTIQNVNYDEPNNTTTFELIVGSVGSQHGFVDLQFSKTKRSNADSLNSGITNIKITRPGYNHDSNQVFNTEMYNALNSASFSVIRAMGLTGTDHGMDVAYPDTLDWNHRKKLTDATYKRMANKKDNAPWEIFIDLCNEIQTDIWLNIPIQASEHYIKNLAKLVQERLDPELNIYLEISNEVWGFENPKQYNHAQASDLGLTPQQNITRLAVNAGLIFADVFGEGSMNTRIRPILAWFSVMYNDYVTMLDWINTTYGSPSDYLYSISDAIYVGSEAAYGSHPYENATIEEILSTFKPAIEAEFEHRKNMIALANQWNLTGGVCHYEGGPSISHSGLGITTNIGNRISAVRDPAFATILKYNLKKGFFDLGGNLSVHFNLYQSYTRYGAWGLTDDLKFPDRNYQFNGIRELLGDAVTPAPPADFHISSIDTDAVTLSWEDVSDDETGFRIEKKEAGGSFITITEVGSNKTSFTDHSLPETIELYYRISSFNGNGSSTVSFPVYLQVLSASKRMIVKPVEIVEVSSGSANAIINNLGLKNTLETGDPIPESFPCHQLGATTEWESYSANDSGFVIFDLGQPFNLTALHLWNSNTNPESGAKDVAIRIANTLAGLDSSQAESIQFHKAPKHENYKGYNYYFNAKKSGRFVKIDIFSDWGNSKGPGMSEIRFLANANPTLDPPATPTSIEAVDIVPTGFSLSWMPSDSDLPISEYSIYLNDSLAGANSDPRIIISKLRENTEYSVKISAKNLKGLTSEMNHSVIIKTGSFEGLSAYQQLTDSLVVIEAENISKTVSIDHISWSKRTLGGSSNNRSLKADPNSGKSYKKNIELVSPRADYYVSFADTGTYYLWIRANTKTNIENDEVYCGMNGKIFKETSLLQFSTATEWSWSDSSQTGKMTFQVMKSGTNVLNLWVADDGIFIDKIIITQDSTYVPLEKGPSETEKIILTAINHVSSAAKPENYYLGSNYPNPFNPETTICYTIPKTSHVLLEVFDIQGRHVTTLINKKQNSGRYEVHFNSLKLSSGIYFYRLKANQFTSIKRMLFIK